jgi:hypothetical protein
MACSWHFMVLYFFTLFQTHSQLCCRCLSPKPHSLRFKASGIVVCRHSFGSFELLPSQPSACQTLPAQFLFYQSIEQRNQGALLPHLHIAARQSSAGRIEAIRTSQVDRWVGHLSMLLMKTIKANVMRRFQAWKARMQREKPVLFENESREMVIVSHTRTSIRIVRLSSVDSTTRENLPTFGKEI